MLTPILRVSWSRSIPLTRFHQVGFEQSVSVWELKERLYPYLVSVQQENILSFGNRAEGENLSFVGFAIILLLKKVWIFETGRLWGELSTCRAACFARDSDPKVWSQLYGFCCISWRSSKGRYVSENSASDSGNLQELQVPEILHYCFSFLPSSLPSLLLSFLPCLFVEKSVSFDQWVCILQPELFLPLKRKLNLKPQKFCWVKAMSPCEPWKSEDHGCTQPGCWNLLWFSLPEAF